ncbi:MAG: DUF4215 domain-containing protein [Candidatus Magasanikbacteria bacterium]|nr:DUF4215 domain-containing protein [Candidatus Magasanikbacteria bacterium]
MNNLFGQNKWRILSLLLIVLIFNVCFLSFVFADTSSSNVNIQAQVGAVSSGGGNTGGGSSGGGAGAPIPPTLGPVIVDVEVVPTQVSARIRWHVQNVQSFSCALDIGVTSDYTGTINAQEDQGFQMVDISGLSVSSSYSYRIRCVDQINQTGTYIGTFSTLNEDTESPVISNVASVPTSVSALVSWRAIDNTIVDSCSFSYDLDGVAPYTYSSVVTILPDNDFQVSLSNLISNTAYFFRITCADVVPNASTALGQFQTDRESVPPPDVSDFRANPRDRAALLTWTYSNAISDLASFNIRRNLGSAPRTISDGTFVASVGRGTREYLDSNLINNTEYFYTIFAVDTSGNNSNGVSVSVIPTVPGDRDNDGVTDDIDLCDLNNPGQIDTPSGTVIDTSNGCPRVTVDMTDLSIWPQFLVTNQPGRITVTIPTVRMRGARIFTTGLQPGVWYFDFRTDNIGFTVSADGRLSWGSEFNNIFSVSYDASGANFTMQGYLVRIDSRGLDPRNSYRIFSLTQSTAYLPDVAELHLYPKTYFSVNQNIAPFILRADGSITWSAAYNGNYSRSPLAFSGWRVAAVGDQTLYVSSQPLCINQDTLAGSYRLWTPQGSSPFVTGSGVYRVLPIPPVPIIPTFSATFPYVQSQASGERRNVVFLTNPDRLIDSYDRETGSLVNLTLNIQNVQASLSTCGVNSRVCGNGTLDFNEQCDDGNTRNSDGCSSFCTRETIALCGNNVLNSGEECDDGNRADHDGCSGLCFLEEPVCGNLFLETGEVCDDGNLTIGDGCSDTCQMEVLPVCGNSTIDQSETCDDGNVLNGDGCSSSCQLEGPAACNDLIDNDRDSFVDMADPGCSSPNDTSEFNLTILTPTTTPNLPFVPGTQTILNPIGNTIQMLIAQRTIAADLIDGVVYSLPGDQLTISALIPFSENVSSTILELNGNPYSLIYDSISDRFVVDVIMPPVGRYDAVVIANYGNSSQAIIPFAVESLPFGAVQSSTGDNLSQATVLLLDDNGDTWNGSQFLQQNPTQTDLNGEFGFLVPNGVYRVTISLDGYVERSLTMNVSNHVFNPRIELTLLSDGTLLGTLNEIGARAAELFGDIRENLRRAAKKVKQFVNDPEVKRVAEHVVQPATVIGVSVVVIPSLVETAIPLFRYLFLQPLLIFGRKKREKWGMVYNSLTKLPVDLSIVRLISKEGKIIQSRVTDRGGRFIFFADSGTYKLDIRRNGFVFPSRILANVRVDGSRIDLYHGELLSINEEGQPVTPNIPIDPGEITRKPWRIIFKKRLHILQHVLSLAGFIMSVAVFYIQPTIKTFAMLAVQLVLYVVFLYFIRPVKPKEWGGVVNSKTGKPIGKAIIRLFDKQYNKLVAMEVTSGNGRYAFLVGQNEYYLTVESEGFETYHMDNIRINDAKGSFVGEKIPLQPIK